MLSQRVAASLLLASAAVGCGAGDDDSTDSPPANYGTCDRRAQVESCIEATGSPRSILDQKDGCLAAKGSWSTSACPSTPELIGCCEYTLGNRFRECFYQGVAITDPEMYCLGQSFFTDGVWTPASP